MDGMPVIKSDEKESDSLAERILGNSRKKEN
jgi:hypothetical protein